MTTVARGVNLNSEYFACLRSGSSRCRCFADCIPTWRSRDIATVCVVASPAHLSALFLSFLLYSEVAVSHSSNCSLITTERLCAGSSLATHRCTNPYPTRLRHFSRFFVRQAPAAGYEVFGPGQPPRLCVNLELHRFASKGVTVLQQRGPVLAGKEKRFSHELVRWARESGFKVPQVLSGGIQNYKTKIKAKAGVPKISLQLETQN